MEYLARSLGSLFQRPTEQNAQQRPGQGQTAAPAPPAVQHEANPPSKKDVLNYLGQLAKDYHLPPKLVYSVADAESSVDANRAPHPNYITRHGRILHDEHGNPRIASWDYGVMQINGKTWFGKPVQDAKGHPFTIGEDVKSDWRANARAGVAILADAHRFAKFEQGPGATAEDNAQQAYSDYNGGQNARDRYLKERRDGLPANDADRNFLFKYRQFPGK